MDVHLTTDRIYYMNESIIQSYSNLKFLTSHGEIVHMNPLILAALKSRVVTSLALVDFEDCCVITEFSRSDLEDLNEFCWTGKYRSREVFSALGIDLDLFLEPPKDLDVDVKIKVKEESIDTDDIDDLGLDADHLDFDDDDEEAPLQKPSKSRKKRGKKSSYHDDEFIDDDDYSSDNDEDNWTPMPRKRGRRAKNAKSEDASFTKEHQEMFESYELPKPLETYKVSGSDAATARRNFNDNDIDNDGDQSNKPYSCEVCFSRFASAQSLHSHNLRIHSEHYNCQYCRKAFSLDQVHDFKLHMFKHENNILSTFNMTCIQCGNFYKEPGYYQRHLKKRGPHHDDQCAQCTEKFSSHEDYKKHVDEMHNGKWILKCGFCMKQFEDEGELKSHSSIFHLQKPMKRSTSQEGKKKGPVRKLCVECGLYVYNLKIHMTGVHGNEKHTCPQCNVVLKTLPALKRHIEWVHVKVPCAECGDMVGLRKMQRHIASKHTSIYDRRFKCDVCGKGFQDNAKLSDHKNIHTGEKPFKCKFCNACFASSGTHAMHQRGHLGHRRSK